MERPRDCPFCAHDDLEVVTLEREPFVIIGVVGCPECGAMGPRSTSDDPAHAVAAWNQRMGRLTVAK